MDDADGKVSVLSPAGRLDAQTVRAFESEVSGVIEAGCRYLVLDFSNLTYLSSAGLRLILRAVKRLWADGGGLSIAACQAQVREILSIAGFENYIPISETVAEARAACAEQAGKARGTRIGPDLGLNLPESFCLLALDPDAGRLRPGREMSIDKVPAACVVIELALQERLEWDTKVLGVTDPSPTGNPVLDRALKVLAEAGRQPIEQCLSRVFDRASEIEQEVMGGLVNRGILGTRLKKIVGLVPVTRFLICDSRPVTALREDLRAVLIGNQLPDMREAVLVGLVNTCGLFNGILSREEIEECRPRISQLWRLDLIGQTLPRLVYEVRRLMTLTPLR